MQEEVSKPLVDGGTLNPFPEDAAEGSALVLLSCTGGG